MTVTFGTVFNRRVDLYRGIALGLADLDLDVILALGPGIDAGEIGPLPSNVQAFPWVPWAPLLAKTRVVISQGGASSTLTSLAHGIPIIVVGSSLCPTDNHIMNFFQETNCGLSSHSFLQLGIGLFMLFSLPLAGIFRGARIVSIPPGFSLTPFRPPRF